MTSGTEARLDPAKVRREFPVFAESGSRFAYLDSAATTQKPACVIDALTRAYAEGCANVHRGAHSVGARVSHAYEAARRQVAQFVGAGEDEIVFTPGCTSSLNLVAQSLDDGVVQPGDEVLVSAVEHHSNLLPWQRLCQRTGARLREIPLGDDGQLCLESCAERLTQRTRVVAVSHVSNVLGVINPVREIARLAHAVGAVLVVDGAQAVARVPVDVGHLGCDFYAFSGHKTYAPFGVGVLVAKRTQLAALTPSIVGGGMALEVTLESCQFQSGPRGFEPGTPNVAGAIALGRALEYLRGLGMTAVAQHDLELLRYARGQLSSVPGVRLLSHADNACGVVAFVHDDVHAHDLSTFCDQRGVTIRAGHHCAQPLMRRLGVVAAARASFGVYNETADVDALVQGLQDAVDVFSPRAPPT